MQFTLELLDKLIWPGMVIVLVLIFRVPLLKLTAQARRLKYKDFEVEFEQKLKGVVKKAANAFPELKKDRKLKLMTAAEKLPNSTLLEAWRLVDEVAEKLVRSRGGTVDLDVETRYKVIENFLLDEKIIDTKKGKLYRELRQLRNKVAHAPGFTVGKAEVVQYIELCFRLIDYFESLMSNGGSEVTT